MRAQLYSIQELPAGQISIMARPRGGDWLLDEVKALREAGVDVKASTLPFIVVRGWAELFLWPQA